MSPLLNDRIFFFLNRLVICINYTLKNSATETNKCGHIH